MLLVNYGKCKCQGPNQRLFKIVVYYYEQTLIFFHIHNIECYGFRLAYNTLGTT